MNCTHCFIVALAACSSQTCPATDPGPTRDFTVSPAVVDQPSFTRLFAISDVHGGYDRLVVLLLANGLIASPPVSPSACSWSADDATLVVIGDLIDKGAQSVEVVDCFRALEQSAARAGGQVIVTLGNHEAEFLADPYNSKADPFDSELSAEGLDPCVVATSDPRGRWLRTRPLAARIGDWFFSHAGQTAGRDVAGLERALEAGLAGGFADSEIIGADSILEARDWWDAPSGVAQTNADALGVAHLVFGHTPDALGPPGAIATSSDLLFRIDVGMSPAVNDSDGALLGVTHTATGEAAVELRADGTSRSL
jgi:hypothetical protein